MKTGRDVIVGALLGGEEYGFGTSALVAGWLRDDSSVSPEYLSGGRCHTAARFAG